MAFYMDVLGLIQTHLYAQTEKNLVLRPIIIKAGAINSEKVAKAMIKIANENLKKTIFESDEIVEISSG